MVTKTQYKVVNGISFDKNTPEKVIQVLLYAMNTRQRIRIFYGDKRTGKDWCETYDTMGYVGSSMGPVKIPILVNNSRSMGGSAILTGSIVRITIDRRDVYRHPKYHMGKIVLKPSSSASYPYGVWIGGTEVRAFKTAKQAEKWVPFIKGETNAR